MKCEANGCTVALERYQLRASDGTLLPQYVTPIQPSWGVVLVEFDAEGEKPAQSRVVVLCPKHAGGASL